jgi:hypothetical protein
MEPEQEKIIVVAGRNWEEPALRETIAILRQLRAPYRWTQTWLNEALEQLPAAEKVDGPL